MPQFGYQRLGHGAGGSAAPKVPTELAASGKQLLSGAEGSSHTTQHTTPSGDNRLLVAVVNSGDEDGNWPVLVSGITYNGDSMTSAFSQTGSFSMRHMTGQVFYLVSPDVGADQDLVTTMASSLNYTQNTMIGLYWFTGASQSDPITTPQSEFGAITSVTAFNESAEHEDGGHGIFQIMTRNNNSSCYGIGDNGSDVTHPISMTVSGSDYFHEQLFYTGYPASPRHTGWSGTLAFEEAGENGNNQEFYSLPLQTSGCIGTNQWRWITTTINPV